MDKGIHHSPQTLILRELLGNPVPWAYLSDSWRENACVCGCPVRSLDEKRQFETCPRCGDFMPYHFTAQIVCP